MELYKIIATCTNYTGAGNPRTFLWIPENFKGVKITQKFNWINPMGYTPTFSVETMKAISTDKIWLDAIFDLYGLESVVSFAIYKLNSTGDNYVLKSTFAIDFESYSKEDYYSEFALKSISCIDDYNKTKNTAKNFAGAVALSLPTTQKYINYISLKKLTGGIDETDTNKGYLNFGENENSNVFNNDTALYWDEKNVYEFGRGASGTTDISINAIGRLLIEATGSLGGAVLSVGIYKNDYTTLVLALTGTVTVESYGFSIIIDLKQIKIDDLAFDDLDILFVGVVVSNEDAEITAILGDFSLELYAETEIGANEFAKKINYLTAETILDDIFNDNATIETALKSIGVASAQSILKRLTYISLVPKDFLSDFCIANGAMVNFKNDETVEISKITTYFEALLDEANAIEVTDFKDVSINFDSDLNFVSVSVGMEQKDYDVYTYLNDWNKILTFIQTGRNASENLDLSLNKYRIDFSGLLDFAARMSKTAEGNSTDMFFLDPTFTPRSSSEGFIYDHFVPRDILENWRVFLEFCFYNFSKDTLTFSSSSGDAFNLELEPGYNQFDDFVFSGDTPKILPLKINLTCLISDTDFTESILKINHNSVDLFIFVTEAQTTDNLEEQKIKGNLIYFPVPT